MPLLLLKLHYSKKRMPQKNNNLHLNGGEQRWRGERGDVVRELFLLLLLLRYNCMPAS